MKKTGQRIAASLLAASMIASAAGCGASSGSDSTQAAAVETTEGAVTAKESAGVSGTFTGAAEGFGGEVTVTLTIEDGILTDVTAEGADETEDVGGRALELMPQTMTAANSVEVDGVSGATVTSNAILEAAAQALDASGGVLEKQEIAVEQHMKPGTYTGEAYGKWKEGTIEGERFGSPAIIRPTKVEVTVDETSILSVEVTDCSDTPGFIEPCIERIPAAVVEQQSVAVDAVTGATLTSQAILTGITQALNEAGADLAGFSQVAAASQESEEYTVDLVIVGAGAAGTMAAVEAMEAGIDTLVLEKCGKLGGTSVCSTGFAAIQSEQQKAAGTDTYTVESAFQELMDFCKWRSNAALVYNVLEESGAVADKIQSYWDQTDNPGVTTAGVTAHNTGKGTDKFNVLYENIIEPSGIPVMLETTAKSLIVDDGRVTGVEAEKQDGTSVTVHAKYVLVCTGGFGGNDEMLIEYLGNDNFYLNGLSTNVGDGINMCLEAGASLSDEISPHLAEFCSNKNVDFYAGYMKFINQAGFLALDPSGERFVNEEFFVTQALSYGASALRRVGYAYIIFTQDQLDAMVENGLWGVLSEETIESLKLRERIIVPSYYTLNDEMEAALAAGEAWKADSLEELGEAIGFEDQSIYQNAISDYLTVLETGEDPLFGKRADMMPDLDQGAYYAVKVISAIDGTYNGIRVNANMQALDQDYQPIEGLYVAGQDSGGFFSYPYYEGVGWTQGYAWTSGDIAAKHVISQLQQ
ncbi:MAG: FAD-dependent oxidoreductase [Clostridiales bacterium]|nr:FAD-dependent oxidoreductase [Clostridiales bacterium]